MKRAGSSQARLARDADIDQSSISRYLRGQCEPNLRQFRAIATALRVAPSFLLADDSVRTVLARSGKRNHYYAFRGGKLVGEWVGESLDVFVAAEVLDEQAASALIVSLDGSRDGSRDHDSPRARTGSAGRRNNRRRQP